jgi:hypothetical protein
MPQYTFFRFEENEDPAWKGPERWVFQFVLREMPAMDEEEMVDIIEGQIDEGFAEPGLWRINESFKGGINVQHGPFQVEE